MLSEKGLDKNVRSTVLLHRGFCYGLTGKYDESVKDLKLITGRDEYYNTENWNVAWKLLEEIKKLKKRTEVVKKMEISDQDKGKEMYLLGNYQNAINLLNKHLEKETKSDKNKSESRYFLGRASEDAGKMDEAIRQYSNILKNSPTSAWAKKANRRLYLMGKFYTENKELAKAAQANSKFFRDSSFIKEIEVFEEMEKIAIESIEEEVVDSQAIDSVAVAPERQFSVLLQFYLYYNFTPGNSPLSPPFSIDMAQFNTSFLQALKNFFQPGGALYQFQGHFPILLKSFLTWFKY